MTRTDITLTEYLSQMTKPRPSDRTQMLHNYAGADGAARLAVDLGFTFLDFPQEQWAAGLKKSWAVAKSTYGLKIPINQSNWEFYIRRELLRYKERYGLPKSVGKYGGKNPVFTKEQAFQYFKAGIAPAVIKVYGNDKTAMRTAWQEYVDMLNKNGTITDKQAATWQSPKSWS